MSQLPTERDGAALRANALQNQRDSLLALAPRAIKTIAALLSPQAAKATGAKVRLDSAKAILDRAGLLPSAQIESSAGDNLADLSASELRRIADNLESELAARATPIRANVANKDPESVTISDE